MCCSGRHDFNKGRCACKNCGIEHKQGLADFVRAGFWPASPDGEKFETNIDQRVFERFAALKDRALHISTKVWLEAFAMEGCAFGGEVCGTKLDCVLHM